MKIDFLQGISEGALFLRSNQAASAISCGGKEDHHRLNNLHRWPPASDSTSLGPYQQQATRSLGTARVEKRSEESNK